MPHRSKSAASLSEADFSATPVWRFVAPDELTDHEADESHVLPHDKPLFPGEHASFLVRASYVLEDATLLPGIVQVDILGNNVEFTPCLVFAAGKAVDPLGAEAATRLARILKSSRAQPARWTLDVIIYGELKARSQAIRKPGIAQALGLLAQLVRLKFSR